MWLQRVPVVVLTLPSCCACCACYLQSKDKQVLELALARGDVPLLTGLAAQPGFSTAGASLHAALPGLPLKLAARLLAAGASINQRDEKDGALLVHKVWRLRLEARGRL